VRFSVADEENNNVEETVDEAVENAAEDSSSSQAAGEESSPAAVDADGASTEEAEPAEPVEVLPPKERRKRAKSHKNRKPKYTGTLEERRAQRDVHRKKKAVQRRAHRAKQREAHKASGPREGTPATVTEPGTKKIQQGTVVSSKTDKTITVAIDVQESHRMYKKVVRHTKKLTAHDATNDANEGDVVRVIESRPLSRTKRWRLVEVVERAR
jgi:small subunit ribosomal protein S17